MEDNTNSEKKEWLEKARQDYDKFCTNGGVMTFTEFEIFYNQFLPDEVKAKYPAENIFKDFAKNREQLEKNEFENVWEELNLFKTETKDSI